MINSNIRILQANLNRSAPATESALQTAVELQVDLLVVQEPWLITNTNNPDYTTTRSILHSSYSQILPADKSFRPRTLIYVSKSFQPVVSLAATSPTDPDIIIVDITEGKSKIQLYNVYNKAS